MRVLVIWIVITVASLNLSSCRKKTSSFGNTKVLSFVEGRIEVNSKSCLKDEIFIGATGHYSASYEWVDDSGSNNVIRFPKEITGSVKIFNKDTTLLDAMMTLPDVDSANAIQYRLINSVNNTQLEKYALEVCINNQSSSRSGLFKFGVKKYRHEGWLK